MKNTFYLLNMDVSGIKSIQENVHLSFYKKTVDKGFDSEKYRVKAIYGENGAGKTTLMSILFGLFKPDTGEIKVNGQTVNFKSAIDASKEGIGMVHQHFKLVDVYTLFENIILGAELTNKFGFIKKTEARNKILGLSKKYNLKVNLDTKAINATVGEQQRTEILKLLYRDSNILIFDEPFNKNVQIEGSLNIKRVFNEFLPLK